MNTKNDAIEALASRPYRIEIETAELAEDGGLAYLAEWPHCFSAGRSAAEAVTELEAVKRELMTYRVAHGLDIPAPLSEVSGQYPLRMPKRLQQRAESRARAEGVSLNQWLTSVIAEAIGPASHGVTHRTVGAGRVRATTTRKIPTGTTARRKW